MNKTDYVALYDAIISLAGDFESNVPLADSPDFNDEAKIKYAYANEILNIVNDVIAPRIDFAKKQGVVIPPVE